MPLLISRIKNAYAVWKKFAEAWGELVMSLIFGAIYLTVFSIFVPIMRKRDPLGLKTRKANTFWIERPKSEISLAQFQKMS